MATETAQAVSLVDSVSSSPLLQLDCVAQNYAWGREASRSEVASLVAASGGRISEDARYAELWMGTHPSGPSVVSGTGTSLKDWIEEHPETLGTKVQNRFGKDLPYLFKVLSVDTALSIQAHPDKQLAAKLHKEKPDIYKDGNHKPEMAIAISDNFSALCRFVSREELLGALDSVPELVGLLGGDAVEVYRGCGEGGDVKEALRELYGRLARAPEAAVREAVGALAGRLEAERAAGRRLGRKEELVLRLQADYPFDVGILSVFFLNLMELREGQGMFLDANEPHAYLSGELVEIMATSDNVVRAGLTPKLRDVEVLLGMLTYNQGAPQLLDGEEVREYTYRYSPPLEEFQLERVDVPPGKAAGVPPVPSPQIVLVHRGSAAYEAGPARGRLRRGDVYFVPAGTGIRVQAEEPLRLWIANVSSAVWDT